MVMVLKPLLIRLVRTIDNFFVRISNEDLIIGLVVINAQDVELPLRSDYISEQVDNKKAKVAYAAPFRANTMRMEVPPGKYIVLPFTVETNKDLKFMLRLFTEMPAILKLIN